MEKIVVKTAVKTVLVILGVIVVLFAIFNFAFPQHMATLTESMGNYSLAVKYASLRYYYTDDCADLARCVDDSILLGNDAYVLQYGEEIVARSDFEDYCRKMEEENGDGYDYRAKVLTKVAISYYNTGRVDEAINTSSELCGTSSFVYGNALMALCARIKSNSDASAAARILPVLEGISPTEESERENLTKVIESMRSVTEV